MFTIHLRHAALGAALAVGVAAPAMADTAYPTKSIEVIVPFPAGGTADILARIMAEEMSDSFGHPVVTVNRPGGAGAVAAQAAAAADPDGYTLFFGTTGTQTMNQWIQSDLPYRPLEDFTAVSNFAESPFVLVVHPDFPAADAAEFIELARSRPGELNYASFGVGSSAHLTGELMKLMAEIDLEHVPYQGAPPALADVAGGHVESMFSMLPAALPLLRGERVRAIAVASRERDDALPDVPTFAESGLPDFVSGSWYGVFAPKGTPDEVVAKLNEEIKRILELPDVRQRLADEGARPVWTSPEDFAEQVKREAANWGEVVEAANIGD